MSRHIKELSNNMTFAYGFDRPLQEYFFQYMDVNGEIIREGAGASSVLLTEIESLGQKMFPMNHIMDVAMDLPIRESK
jgi:hypothetical protein